jgi:selenocysteine lyase/cysteine desulfurase
MLEHWSLDPEIIYLNHGTVGAPPRRVLAAQQRLRDEMARQPSRFLLRELTSTAVGSGPLPMPRLRAAAGQVAEFLGARGDDLVFVDNATTGVNAVLRSFDLRHGDEILLLDGCYGAVRHPRYRAARHGADSPALSGSPCRPHSAAPRSRTMGDRRAAATTRVGCSLDRLAAAWRSRGGADVPWMPCR